MFWGQTWSCIGNGTSPPGAHSLLLRESEEPAVQIMKIKTDRKRTGFRWWWWRLFFPPSNLRDHILFCSSGNTWSRQIQFQNLNFRCEWLVLLFVDVTKTNWFWDDVWPQTCILLHVRDSSWQFIDILLALAIKQITQPDRQLHRYILLSRWMLSNL